MFEVEEEYNFLTKILLKEILNNNQNEHSMGYINPKQIIIVIVSSKMKF